MTSIDPARSRGVYLPWVRAAAFTLVSMTATAATGVLPLGACVVLSVGVGLLAVPSAPLALIAFWVVFSVPIMLANLLVGTLVLLAGFATTPWLCRDGAIKFLLVALAAVLAPWHLEWAPAIVAGYLLATWEGATVAAVACLVVEAVGFTLGRAILGAQATGGTMSLLAPLTAGPLPQLSVTSVLAQVRTLDASAIPLAVSRGRDWVVLALQPVAWASVALLVGSAGTRLRAAMGRVMAAAVAAAVGAVALTATMLAIATVLRSPVPAAVLLLTGALSGLLAIVWLVAREALFPALAEEPTVARSPLDASSGPPPEPAPSSVVVPSDTAEADAPAGSPCDRLVAAIGAQPGSRLEASGSAAVMVAEAVPAPTGPEDPLGPVVETLERMGARGTSGPGALVAAFPDAAAALAAASEAQRVSAAWAQASPSDSFGLRVGVAAGALLLDRNHRPVGGSALALAARARALAAPGQVVATAETVNAAPGVRYELLGGSPAGDGAILRLVDVPWRPEGPPGAS